MNDLERAKRLGLTLDEFQRLVGFDPLEVLSAAYIAPDVVKKKKKKKKDEDKDVKAGMQYSLVDEYYHINEKIGTPYETDEDVKNKNAREINKHWSRPVVTEEDKALYFGYHIHSKDNVYGLHAHYPGGPLGGGHRHTPANPLGYHTHRYNMEELTYYRFSKPGIMIDLSGPHEHLQNAPDGLHMHEEEHFGPENPQSDLNIEDLEEK